MSVVSLAASNPRLVELHGSKVLKIHHGKKTVSLKKGSSISVPARIITDDKTSVVVEFKDKSRAVIAKNTDVEIDQPKNGTQWNVLHSGFVRTEVTKPATPSKRFLFGYKTKSAVMGVRGTIFDINETPETKKTELRTLDGEVQVAEDQKSLDAGKGQSVLMNQLSVIDAGKIQAPVAFNRDEYLNKLQSLHRDLPKVEALTRALPVVTAPVITAPAVTLPPVTAPPVTLPPAPSKPKLPF